MRWNELCCSLTAHHSERRMDNFNVVYSTYEKWLENWQKKMLAPDLYILVSGARDKLWEQQGLTASLCNQEKNLSC